MIKFFRQIRKNLLSEGKFSKYLIYALGEIFLVVLGILIAVSLNNKNEKRKNNEELENILFIVKGDLKTDIGEIDTLLMRWNRMEKHYTYVLNDSLTRKDLEKGRIFTQLAYGYPEIIFKERGINLLKGYKENEIQVDKNLVSEILNFYKKTIADIKIDEISLNQDYQENRRYYKENTTWYRDVFFKRDRTDFITYALNNVDYKNRVYGTYRLLYGRGGYFSELNTFKERAIEIIELIDDHLKIE